MVSLKFNLTEEEFYQFNYYTTWQSPDRKGYRIRYFLRIFLLYAGVAAVYIITNHSSQLLIDFIIFGIIGLVYFLLIPYLVRKSIRRRARDVLAQPENKHVLEESEIIIDDKGIVDKDKVSETRYDWEAIVRKAETKDSYYLYTNSYHAIVIPKRTMRDPQNRQELERLFNRHLPLSTEFPAA
jgi:hypothetical protein